VDNWNQVDPAFPDQGLKLFGAGTDSGTFDYFTDEINGEEGASRSDYSATEDDNVTVTGVSGDKGALGYFGFSYFEENQDALKAVEIDGGDGCVAPSSENAQNGTYKPLSRPLYIYAKRESFGRPEVEAFVRYMIDNETEIAEAAKYVPLTDEQIAQAEADLEAAVGS
jgi:phosphate transport system substrate-binding protein